MQDSKPTIDTTKPVYEAPLVMDLSKIQTGEGGITCTNGSADLFGCNTGAGFINT